MTSETVDSNLDFTAAESLQQIKAMEAYLVPKGTAMAIVRLTQRESTSVAVLAHAIKTDLNFAMRLIKVAKGVSGSGSRPVVSVRDAVHQLGVPAVRLLALGFSVLSHHRSGDCAGFDYARFWSHSLARAIALQLLVAATGNDQPEHAFGVGLLARIGELTLATTSPQQYDDLLKRHSEQPEISMASLRLSAFGVAQSTIAASMMDDYGVPLDYTEPVKFFENLGSRQFEDDSDERVVQQSIALADYIADICMAPQAMWRAMMPKLFQMGSGLLARPDKLTALCNRVAHEWKDWGETLGVDTHPMPRFEAVHESPGTKASDPAGAPADADTSKSLRLLLVGDGLRVCDPIRDMLTNAGHEVYEATNGRLGFSMAVELQPQIMLVDNQVEGMDGLELTRSLRQSKMGRSIYVVILGTSDDDQSAQALEAGADNFVAMPLTQRLLAAQLRAGQRVVMLQEELVREQEEIKRISAELSVRNQQLQEVGTTDLLTGCPNRRHAMDRIEQEWAMATRSQRPLACMVIDIDNLKRVNDIHGHGAGDTVVKLVAAALKGEMRVQDVLARTGGDEFLVICPDTTLDAAISCAERMRLSVEILPTVFDGHPVSSSVSLGVAVRDATLSDPDALIRLADQGAYLAKRSRNTVATVQSAIAAALPMA